LLTQIRKISFALILSKNVFTSEDWQAAREETVARMGR